VDSKWSDFEKNDLAALNTIVSYGAMVNYFELIQPFGGIMCQLMREEKARKKSE
jgi:hypothetical protein